MTESEKEFLQRDLLHKMDQLIDKLCKEVGDNNLTANEIRTWLIPTVNKLLTNSMRIKELYRYLQCQYLR